MSRRMTEEAIAHDIHTTGGVNMARSRERRYGPWFAHLGGHPPGTFYMSIRTRDGREFDTELPHSWVGWEHTGGSGDIVAYRKVLG